MNRIRKYNQQSLHHIYLAEENNVFRHSQLIKEDVMLGTQAKGAAHLVHLRHYVVATHLRCARGGWEQA